MSKHKYYIPLPAIRCVGCNRENIDRQWIGFYTENPYILATTPSISKPGTISKCCAIAQLLNTTPEGRNPSVQLPNWVFYFPDDRTSAILSSVPMKLFPNSTATQPSMCIVVDPVSGVLYTQEEAVSSFSTELSQVMITLDTAQEYRSKQFCLATVNCVATTHIALPHTTLTSPAHHIDIQAHTEFIVADNKVTVQINEQIRSVTVIEDVSDTSVTRIVYNSSSKTIEKVTLPLNTQSSCKEEVQLPYISVDDLLSQGIPTHMLADDDTISTVTALLEMNANTQRIVRVYTTGVLPLLMIRADRIPYSLPPDTSQPVLLLAQTESIHNSRLIVQER